jgi:GNAT superfamily N-acetyltransferase
VAERNDSIVGFVAGGPARDDAPPTPGELHALYLLARQHGLGIGRGLFERIRDSLTKRSLMPMSLWVIEGNPACRFYERMGGRRTVRQAAVIRGTEIFELAYEFEVTRS